MKISLFTHMRNPEERMDPWREALECYESITNDIVIVGQDVEQEFKWDALGKMFQEGFDKSEGDWVINLSIDMLLHENDINRLIKLIKLYPDEPAIALPKYKFFEPERYQIKSFETVILNKKKYKNILFNGGGDLALPTLNNTVLNQSTVKHLDIPVWNYDTTFRTKEIIAEDRARFARAWFREFADYGDRGGPTNKEAFEAWFTMMKERYPFHTNKTKLKNHPKYIQHLLEDLREDQFGYNLFGFKEEAKFTLKNKINQKRIKFKFKI